MRIHDKIKSVKGNYLLDARVFFIVSANVTTGISEICNAASETPAYNIAGQRVNSYQRGIIVKNGKKILNK